MRRPPLLLAVLALLALAVSVPAFAAERKATSASAAKASNGNAAKAKSKGTAKQARKRPRCDRRRPRLIRTTRTTLRDGTRRTRRIYCNGTQRVTDVRPGRRETVVVPGPERQVPVPVPGPTVVTPGPERVVEKPVSPPPFEPKPYRLTLLHNGDGESKLRTGDSVASYGGAARFKTVVDRLRAQEASETAPDGYRKGLVTVAAGDNFLAGIGFLASTTNGTFYDALALNRIGYDALVIGNHEFDFGQARLADFIEDLDGSAPFLSANLGFENTEPRLRRFAVTGRIKRSHVVEKGGDRIGIIGLTTPDITTISSPGNVQVNSRLAEVVNDEVAELQKAGVNKIVVGAHLQALANDRTLIAQTRGVDLWISAGGGEFLNSGNPVVPGSTAAGPYPTSEADADGRLVQIVAENGEYRYVGKLQVDFDAAGEIVRVLGGSGPVRVSGNSADADRAAEDGDTKAAAVDPVTQFETGLANTTIGTQEVDYVRTRSGAPGNDPIRRRESGYGNLIADSFLWKAQQAAAGAGVDSPQVSIVNGGGIRADLLMSVGPPNRITGAETFGALPFFNRLVVVEDISCERLRQLLERPAARLGNGPTYAINGAFGHVAGMRVEIDTSQTGQRLQGEVDSEPAGSPTVPVTIRRAGARVRNLWLDNGTPGSTADDTQLIANGATAGTCPAGGVDLATSDFTANDGDGYPFSTQGLTSTVLGLELFYNEALEDFIRAPAAQGGLDGTVLASRYPATITDGSGGTTDNRQRLIIGPTP